MKFSEQWLRQWVNPEASTEELAAKITMAGLEVDGVEAVAGEFTGIVVGEIVACEQHPDADKLRVTRVSTGSEEFQVVCGAPNARVGLKAPFATIGAVLPGNFKIKKAKLRGVESFGMLCAGEEMGMDIPSDGLMELPADAPVGQDIREYLNLDDAIIDVDLTPNRGDCLSIAGLAREVSANYLADVSEPEVAECAPQIDDTFPVKLEAPAGCPRYVGRVIRDVNVAAETPLWLSERLRRAGIRSIDPVVDVTNYVMIELGQPMHGFDLDTLSGSIRVRMAETDEPLTLLDGSEVKLTAETLVIADESKALAIAGVMGGENTGVSTETRNIFLESAFFNPITIAGKARSYGLHTDSSHRFERGVDFQLQRKGIERATQLILEICGGQPGPVSEVASEADLPSLKQVNLRAEKVESLLGVAIENDHIEALLSRLGLTLTATGAGTWTVAVPSWRFDISIEEDLVEELGRIYGYNNLPETTPVARVQLKQIDEGRKGIEVMRRVLVARGYQEAINFSFIDPALHKAFEPELEPVALSNPISSEMSVMRTSLLPGLVKTVQYNQNRQQQRIRLFESGQTFVTKNGELAQELWLAGVITGSREPEGWTGNNAAVDFYDIKGDLEALLALGGDDRAWSFRTARRAFMHPGQCAEVLRDGEVVGVVGALHPSLVKLMDLNGPAYLFEVNVAAVEQGRVTEYQALSKFPEVRRDMALIVDQTVAAGDIEQIIREQAGEWLKTVTVFDVYTGQGVPEGQKSLALGLTLQHPSRTFKDDEINALFASVVSALENGVKATLRK